MNSIERLKLRYTSGHSHLLYSKRQKTPGPKTRGFEKRKYKINVLRIVEHDEQL
ncbi:hypothetical protein GCM10011389_37620 [Pontibacillus salipaludis]|uniref:50S ribosomal protein L33 n=1 Tax=Pontibacillus salipaludis TaxID=1697394 RepID=A0ABQ1QG35_9BACI|nr:hypothetical protein GCM10011389_37620 [Pontibacillus salipaludis]